MSIGYVQMDKTEMAKNKDVPKFDLYSSGVPSPEAVDELHN